MSAADGRKAALSGGVANRVVLDASAVLALIFAEPGSTQVEGHLPGAAISAVNIAEVATRLFARGMPEDTINTIIGSLQLSIRPFDHQQALATARLRPATRSAGLSLGDRACLALAGTLQYPALTADKAWSSIADDIAVTVRLIR